MAIDIEPLDIYNEVYPEFLQFNQEFRARNNNYEFQDYTDENLQGEYLSPLIQILTDHEDNLTYREPTTVTVHVAPDDSGRYTITDEEVTSIYNAWFITALIIRHQNKEKSISKFCLGYALLFLNFI